MAKSKATPVEEISEDLVKSELKSEETTTEVKTVEETPVFATTPGHPSRDFHS